MVKCILVEAEFFYYDQYFIIKTVDTLNL